MPESSKGFTAPPQVPGDTTDKSWLCAVCDSLGLNIQRFVVGSSSTAGDASSDTGSADSPTANRGPRRGRDVESGNGRLGWGSPRNPFAKYSELQGRREECRFCDLVLRAIERYSGERIDVNALLTLRWEFDSWESDKTSVGSRTRRIRIGWLERDNREMVVYLLFVGSTQSAQPSTLDASPSMAETYDLVKGWVNACVTYHGPRCQGKHGDESDFKQLVEGTYFGVVDVDDMQLKALPMTDGKPSQYVALSYIWGKNAKSSYTTRRSNVMLHIQHNGLQTAWDKLPKTIQDAILLVRKLGERYLWVDSLCIVQDSKKSWELNARSMHMVYGNAHFTICAADRDADAGLTAVSDRDEEAGHRSPSLMVEVLPGICLLATRPAESVIQDTCWSQRGWTFQERLLSRRCLIFANRQLYFQCRSSVASQHTSGSYGCAARTWSLDLTNSPMRMLRDLPRRAFWFYMRCVALYTARHLTRPRDVLAAFSGISWLLREHMNAPLLYGLPTSHLDLALLWTPSERLDLRRKNSRAAKGATGCTRDEMGNCTCSAEDDYGDFEFPSWSWAGWQSGRAEYRSEILEGALDDVQEWLKHHTWIQWYLRDHEGNLRPLWDKKVVCQDGSDLSNWRGYAGKAPSSAAVTTEPELSALGPYGASQSPFAGEAGGSLHDLRLPFFQEMMLQQLHGGQLYFQERMASRPEGLVSPNGIQAPSPREPLLQPIGRSGNAEQDVTKDEDDYGRPLRETLKGRNTSNFTGVLPDNPFGIIQKPYPEQGTDDACVMPILQFWTWRTELYVTAQTGGDGRPDDTGTTSKSTSHSRALVQCDISDKSGDWCGSISLPSAGVAALSGSAAAARPFHFIALSEAKAFTAEECPVWNYYNSRERDDSEWGLYFVMLVQRNKVTALWERVAVGKVFQAAFRDAKWSEVKLG